MCIDGYGVDEMATADAARCSIPWPNRLQDGSYEFGGATQLPLDEPEHSNAIHGLVRWVAWRAAEHEPHRVVLEQTSIRSPGYPFTLELRIEYELSPSGLTVRRPRRTSALAPARTEPGRIPTSSRARRRSTRRRSVSRRTACSARTPARSPWTVRSRFPGGEGGSARRSSTPGHGSRREATTVSLASRCLGRTAGTGVVLWADEGYGYVTVYTGDDRRRCAAAELAVEPMTCPPNASRSGEAVVTLDPGESVTARWGLTPG